MWVVLFIALTSLSADASAYRLSSSEPRSYAKGDQLAADVLSLAGGFTSSLAAEAGGLKYSRSRRGQRPKPATALQPVDYYSLPFCRPAVPADAHRGKPSFTSLLFGGQAQDAPFYFRMMVEEKVKSACEDNGHEPVLSTPQAQDLQQRIEQGYWMRLELDGLPVTTYDLQLDPVSVRPGFPLGFTAGGRHFVNNHLMFLVLVHRVDESQGQAGSVATTLDGIEQTVSSSAGPHHQARNASSKPAPPAFTIVGVMVVPCSIRRRPSKYREDIPCPVWPDDPDGLVPQEVMEGAQIAYTYDVYWEESDITWDRRWDSYTRLPAAWERARWLSALISGIVAAGLVVAAILIVRRTARERSASYQLIHKNSDLEKRRVTDTGAAANGEAAKTPLQWRHSCGVAAFWSFLATTAAAVLGTAAAGCFSSSMRGHLLPLVSIASALVATMLAFAPLEYATGPFYDDIVARRVTRPGMALMPVMQLYQYYTLKYAFSSDNIADRMSVFLMAAAVSTSSLSRLWCTGMLLSSLHPISARDTSIKAGRHTDVAADWFHRAALYVACSMLPFAACAVEFFIAMTCIWQGYAYSVSAPVLLTATIAAVISVETSVMCACVELPTHDGRWWLRTLQRTVSPAVCFLLSSLAFLAIQLRPKSLPDIASFLLWTVLVIMAASGVMAIGFLSTFLLMKLLARTMSAKGTTATTSGPVSTHEPARAQQPLLGEQCEVDMK